MQVHFRYFKWNPHYNLNDIQLGDDIDLLLDQGLVNTYEKDGHIEFKYSRDESVN